MDCTIRNLGYIVVATIHESNGHGAVLTNALFLLRFKPRHNSAARNLLSQVHHAPPVVWAKAKR